MVNKQSRVDIGQHSEMLMESELRETKNNSVFRKLIVSENFSV